jgi:N-acetylglucosamine-1-phosphate uridyltransferase (contains nucleotidyltransferase and I-patch acetyltransferase domains)
LNPALLSGGDSGFHWGRKTLYDGGGATFAQNLRNRMTGRTSLTIVLAAGEGTRMRSTMPKVLHPVAGQSLLAHVLGAAPKGAGTALAVVIGPGHEAVAAEAKRVRPDALTFVQRERLGTAHAVLAARDAMAGGADDLLVVFGDTPLISAATFERLRTPLKNGAALAVLGFRAADPTGYGRLLVEGDRLVAIREQADATAEERAIKLSNAGVMAFDGRKALQIIEKIGNANRKREYYLSDAVAVVREMGLEAVVIETSEDEVRGINTKAQLAEAEHVMQARLRQAALDAGVTMIAPETVYLAADTKFGTDVTIEPFVVIGPGVSIGRRRGDPFVFPHRAGIDRQQGVGRTLCAVAAGNLARRGRQNRQLRRDQGGHPGGGRQGQSSQLYRRCACRRQRQHRRGHHHLQLRRF